MSFFGIGPDIQDADGGTRERRRRLDDLRQSLSRLEGEVEALRRRDGELVTSVGRAKGRLEKREEVSEVLERMQTAAHERAVGSFERMLTAISEDVLGRSMKIGLDLYTERGLPALDIFVDKGDGRHEDAFEGQGGALTNALSLGLRMIALARSKRRLFLALDEPEPWTNPARVPAFVGVIGSLARQLGVQTLMVTHHAAENFDGSVSISRGQLNERDAFDLEPEPRPHHWSSEEKGLRYIRLLNFMSHRDTYLPLNPGVNVLLGDNNIGKSVFPRALKAIAYGECSDRDIRHGADEVVAEVGIEGGRAIRFSRKMKRNPRSLWTLLDANGEIEREAGGRTPPDWVADYLGIEQIEGMDVQIGHQKQPVFILGEPATKRATVLSVGRESDLIRKMISRHKEWITEDNRTVREGEKELSSLRSKLTKLDEATPALKEEIEGLKSEFEALEKSYEEISKGDHIASKIANERRRLELARRTSSALSDLVEPPDISETERMIERGEGVVRAIQSARLRRDRAVYTARAIGDLPEVPEMNDLNEIVRVGKCIRQAMQRRDRARKETEALKGVPDAMPDVPDTSNIDRSVSRIQAAWTAVETAAEKRKGLDHELAEARKAVEDVVSEGGNQCPTCGGAVDDIEQILEERSHVH